MYTWSDFLAVSETPCIPSDQRIYEKCFSTEGPSWWWSYRRWISNYLCNQCLSPLTLRVRISLKRDAFDSTLCDKVCQWLVTDPGTPVSSTNKTDRHDITAILLKVALSTINLNIFWRHWRRSQIKPKDHRIGFISSPLRTQH